MGRITLDDFADKQVARIYLAGELPKARRVEKKILTVNGNNYATEVEL